MGCAVCCILVPTSRPIHNSPNYTHPAVSAEKNLILLHVYMEQFLKEIIYFMQSLPEIMYFKNTPALPPVD